MAEYKGLSAELKEANLAHGEYADKLAAAIIKWVSMQTFTITEMTADVEVTRIETTGDIPVNTSRNSYGTTWTSDRHTEEIGSYDTRSIINT